MTTKIMEVVVCDLHKTDRPATVTLQIDVCEQHAHILEARTLAFVCEHCDRRFARQVGLTKHQTDVHGKKGKKS